MAFRKSLENIYSASEAGTMAAKKAPHPMTRCGAWLDFKFGR
jgi:hypothetical protein